MSFKTTSPLLYDQSFGECLQPLKCFKEKQLQTICIETTISMVTAQKAHKSPQRVCYVTRGKVYERDETAVAYTCLYQQAQKQIG